MKKKKIKKKKIDKIKYSNIKENIEKQDTFFIKSSKIFIQSSKTKSKN